MRYRVLTLLIIVPILAFSQNQKAYMAIVSSLQQGEIESATAMLKTQVKKEKKESEWYKLLDDTYKYTDNVKSRIELLESAQKVKDIKERELLKFRLSIAYFDAGRYDECLAIIDSLPQKKPVIKVKKECLSAKKLKADSLKVKIEPMGDSINTPYDNIWPIVSNDKKRFYTTVVLGKSTVKPKSYDIQEDIFVSEYKDSLWLPTSVLQGELRSNENEGACTISADGKYLFFAACNRGGSGGCEIYYSRYVNGKWSRPFRAQAPLNSFSWQSTPSISADGKTLYFSAVDSGEKVATTKKRAIFPNKDIYQCSVSYNADGSIEFSNIKKLGPEINTEYDEISPFISPYGNILYFASDGRGGMGGLDIYYSKRLDDGTWGEAINIGYPINTHRDEFGFSVDVDGRHGYMSCNGLEEGEFWQNKRIVSIPLSTEHFADAPFEAKSSDFILENIYFDIDRSELKAESFAYLDKFKEYLVVHPNYKVEISGHTDSSGTEDHNIELSQQRALSVAEYLKKVGISSSRIKTSGYGSSKPIDTNNTDEGRAANRRIEVKIVE